MFHFITVRAEWFEPDIGHDNGIIQDFHLAYIANKNWTEVKKLSKAYSNDINTVLNKRWDNRTNNLQHNFYLCVSFISVYAMYKFIQFY